MGGFSTAYLFDFVVRIVSGKDDFQTIEGSEYLCLDAGEEGNLIFDVFRCRFLQTGKNCF